jgi:hypothetical protein
MQSKNSKGADGFELIVFDLYDIVIEYSGAEGFLEQCYAFERRKVMERITKAIGNLLQVNTMRA